MVNCNKPTKKAVLSFVLFLFSLLYVGSDSLVCVSVHAPLQSMDALFFLNAHSQHSIPHLSVFKALAERVGHRHLDVLKPLLTNSGVDLTDELRADRVVVTLQVRPALMHTLLCHLFSL